MEEPADLRPALLHGSLLDGIFCSGSAPAYQRLLIAGPLSGTWRSIRAANLPCYAPTMPDRDLDLLPLIREAKAATDDYQEQTQLAVAAVLNARPGITASAALAIVRRLRDETEQEAGR